MSDITSIADAENPKLEENIKEEPRLTMNSAAAKQSEAQLQSTAATVATGENLTSLPNKGTKDDSILTEKGDGQYITPKTLQSAVTPAVVKKKELIRPLFSRSSTNEKTAKATNINKSMTVETETIDASNAPFVTLPIASSSNIINSEIMSNNSNIPNNHSSLRSKKSTLFSDQNGGLASNSVVNVDESDTISISGSIRNKKLSTADSHLNITKPGATKADLFAAKIANAVGEASDSDSEETFVYESAPDPQNSSNTLPPKSNAALAAANTLALRKLSQRNISMPLAGLTSNTNSNPSSNLNTNSNTTINPNTIHQTYSPTTASNILLTNDDSKEQCNANYDTDDTDPQNTGANHSSTDDNSNKYSTVSTQDTVKKAPRDPESNNQKVFTKYKGPRKFDSNLSSLSKNNKEARNQLRTTTSKLFDMKGKSLRRYSGVPDNVNIEDYFDQYDDEERALGDLGDYDYNEEEEDDEFTPLYVPALSRNSKNKVRNSSQKGAGGHSNFGSLDQSYSSFDTLTKNDNELRHSSSKLIKNTRNKKNKAQAQHSPHNFFNSKKNSKIQLLKNFLYIFVLVLLLLMFGFIAGFLLATTKDLQHVQIRTLDDVLVSYDELVFDIEVQAFNPGFLTVEVSDLDLDIFAKAHQLMSFKSLYLGDSKNVETILLGTVTKLETTLDFTGGFFTRRTSLSKGEIKLIHPGQNSTDEDDDNHKIENDADKWKELIKSPFELIVRGSLKYNLPFFHTQRSVEVTKTVLVDPVSAEKFRKNSKRRY